MNCFLTSKRLCPLASFASSVITFKHAFVGALFLTSVGCTSAGGYPSRSGDTATELKSLEPYFAPTKLAAYAALTDASERQRLRDEIVNGRLRAIDLNYFVFVRALSEDVASLSVGTDIATLALAGAGTIVTGASTKTVLAAVSGFVIGTKGSIDKNLFYQKTVPVLLAAMAARRRTVLLTVRTGLTHEGNQYTLEQALMDVEDYYNAGTIPGALTDITAGAGASLANADAKISQITTGTYLEDDAGKVLRRFWKPDGKNVDKSNATALQAWLTKEKINVEISFFIQTDTFATQRVKAVTDLKLK